MAAWVMLPTAAAQAGYATKVAYPTGSFPIGVAAGDFNGDNRPDVAVVNVNSDNVSVLLATGGGAFANKVDYSTLVAPIGVATGDFNGDNKLDLAVTSNGASMVSVLLGVGDGTFGTRVNYAVASASVGVVVGDFNNDTKLDLAVAASSAVVVSVLLGAGDGTFGTSVNYTAGSSPYALAVGDFNQDGKPDLVVTNGGTNSVSVLLGNGNGTFAAKVDYTTGNYPFAVQVGDFDQDGKPDLAVSNLNSATVSVLLGNGNGTFAAKVDYTTGTNPSGMALDDFNSDGKLDIVVANRNANTVSVLSGNGAGAFAAKADSPAGMFPWGIAVADFDQDGKPDFAVSNFISNTLSIIPNTPTPVSTVTSSANPSAAGNSVTFTDTVCGLGATPTGTVTFKDGATSLGPGTLVAGGGTNCAQATVSTSALSAGSRSITGVYGGDVTFGPSTSNTLTQVVNGPPVTHFVVSAPASATAGTAVNVTVTAKDAGENTVTGYGGTLTWTSSDPSAVLPSSSTSLTNGVGVEPVTFSTAGSRTVTVTDGSSITGTSGGVTVEPGAVTHFAVSAPASATAGTPVTATVTALDAAGNTVTNYSGSVAWSSTDSAAVLPPTATSLTNGVTSKQITFRTSGSQTVTVTDIVANTGTSGSVAVDPGAVTHFAVSAPASTTSGTPETVTVTAMDAAGNTVTSYAGSVTWASTDSAAVLPSSPTSLTGGAGTEQITFTTSGSQTVTATDGSISGTSNSVAVDPGAADHFVVAAPASATVDKAVTATVTAKDAAENTVTGYAGSVAWTSTDSAAVLPSSPTILTNGVGTDSITFHTKGSWTVTATDFFAITGTSNNVTVKPAGVTFIPVTVTHFAVTAPASATAGTTVTVTVTAKDAGDNTVTSYDGTVAWTSTDAAAVLPSSPTSISNGVGTARVTFGTSGGRTVTATDTGSITGTSNNVQVSPRAVTGVQARGGVASIIASWAAVTGASGYTATADPGPSSCSTTTATSCVLGGVAGTAYTVRVVAHLQDGGDSAASAPSNMVIPTQPKAPDTAPDSGNAGLTTDKGDVPAAQPGDTFTVIGAGFAANSTVRITVYSAPRMLATGVTDRSGKLRLPVTLPADLAPGKHTVLAYGVAPDGSTRRLTLTVTVAAKADDGGLPTTGVNALSTALLGVLFTAAGLALAIRPLRRRSARS
ncbi:beta strand repeat-containing protein [Paractinoplanes durhamensis]|uniref:Bacterial Ig-like domain-containing protein n=1 Tax=Paractinoplanes durhamensis TaxID=113563 RepID=A0ABQ3YS13_9ACTN|nr:VCBS repeat-containing protein [Actinoplanes durhamensis]GIE00294.1 hypothetical protein Adu01nite_16440 [Actinoplanes durhamensis]